MSPPRAKTWKRAWLWPLLVVAALLAAGCSSSKSSLVRSLHPSEADTLLGIQKARDRMGNAEDEVKLDPDRLEAHADGLARLQDWPAALYQYSRAIGLAGPEQQRRVRLKMADISLHARMFVPAERLFADLAKGDPKSAQAWEGLGLAFLGQRRPSQALPRFQMALTKRPDLQAIHNNLGLAYLMMGDLGRAESSLRRPLALDAGYTLAANNLGLVLAQRGRTREAIRAFEKGSGPAQAYNNLGTMLAWRGDYAKAAEYFDQAREIMPRYYPLAERHLDLVRERNEASPTASAVSLRSPGYSGQDLPRVDLPRVEWPRPEPPMAEMPAGYLEEPLPPPAPAPTSRQSEAPLLAPSPKPAPINATLASVPTTPAPKAAVITTAPPPEAPAVPAAPAPQTSQVPQAAQAPPRQGKAQAAVA